LVAANFCGDISYNKQLGYVWFNGGKRRERMARAER